MRIGIIVLTFSAILGLNGCNENLCDARTKKSDDLDKPFGWVTCTSLTKAGDYTLTGGGDGRRVVLKSNGEDMSDAIESAIINYDVIVLDGSAGDFMMSRAVELNGIDNRTIFGINNAVLKSIFHITAAMKADFDAIDVEHSGHQKLNPKVKDIYGLPCSNMRTVNYHNIIGKYTEDPEEKWLKSGMLWLQGCNNWIIRNITMIGPGSISSGHTGDVITLSKKCTHFWVDHCTITDGADGNFDINTESDFITVSYCKFDYTERSYGHRLCALIGANANTNDPGHLNVTYVRCCWASNADYGVSRQPMVRYGHVHVLNCYYPVVRDGTLMHARDGSNMLVEGNYFENVSRFFGDSLAANFIVRCNRYNGDKTPIVKGNVEVPYKYEILPIDKVPEVVLGKMGAGATLDLNENSL